MGALFLGSWLGQSFTGMTEYNEAQREHGSTAVSWVGYLQRPPGAPRGVLTYLLRQQAFLYE
jgi:hypothetical protein